VVLPEHAISRFLFCKHAVSNLFVLQTPTIAPHIAQLPLSYKFLIFFLPSLLHFCPPCLPLISGECSIVVLSFPVIWFSCYFTTMNLMIAFFVLSLHHYCIVCVPPAWYCSFRTRGLQCRSCDGWCITTVSSACTTPVHTAWHGSFRTHGLQYLSTTAPTISLVRHYSIMRMYSITRPTVLEYCSYYHLVGASDYNTICMYSSSTRRMVRSFMCLRLLVPYRVHLHDVACCCYGSLAIPAVQYRTICTVLVRFNVNQFADILVSQFFF
jgi:hypothetical protein